MTEPTGWNSGLSQDYDRGLGRWFADRLGAREQLRKDFMTTEHFTREDRYLVLKRKDLHALPLNDQCELENWVNNHEAKLPKRQYVVVESDWPEYETVFKMIEARVTGKPFTHALPAQPAEPVNAELVEEALKHAEEGLRFAYQQGLHEFGYDPIATIRSALSRTQAAQPVAAVPDVWKQAVMRAYGHLWHVNNEPMAPVPLYSIEGAGYEARKQLRDLLTTRERGQAINEVQAMLAAAPQPQQKVGV